MTVQLDPQTLAHLDAVARSPRAPIAEGITTLEDLAAALVIRRKQLGLGQRDVDDIAGLPFKYTGKVEAGAKGLGKLSIPCLLGALKCSLVLVPEDQLAARQLREKKEDFWSRRGRALRAKQLLLQTPKQRRKIARAAGKARQRKARELREAAAEVSD